MVTWPRIKKKTGERRRKAVLVSDLAGLRGGLAASEEDLVDITGSMTALFTGARPVRLELDEPLTLLRTNEAPL